MNRNDKLVLENCYEKIFQEQNDISFEEKYGQIIESEVRLNLNLEGLDDIEGYRNRDDINAIPNINWDSPSKIKIKWFLMLDGNELSGYLLHFDDIEVEYEDYRNSKDDSDPEKGKIKISSKGFDFKKILVKFSKLNDHRSDKTYMVFNPSTLDLTAENFELVNERHEKLHELIVEY
jgi:hypothetical protein